MKPKRPVTIGDVLAEYTQRFEGETLHERTKRMVASLTPKEREILKQRFKGKGPSKPRA